MTSAMTPKASGSSKPFFEAKKPLGMCTLKIAVAMSITSPAAQNRVMKPRNTQTPPTNSVIETTHAKMCAGSTPILVSMPATPETPPPPNAPRSFCEPCIMKANPRNSLRITTANRSNPSSRCGTDDLLFSRALRPDPQCGRWWTGRFTAARMPVRRPSPQDSVLLGLARPAELGRARAAVAAALPEPVADDGENGGGHDQEERPLPPEPFEHDCDLVAEDPPEDDPHRGERQRADQVIEHEAAVGDSPGAAQDRCEQPDARRVAPEKDRGGAEALEVPQRILDAPLGAEREPAVERQEPFSAAGAGEKHDVIAHQGPERAGGDRDGELDTGRGERSGEHQQDAARERDPDRVDRAHREHGQVKVRDQEHYETIGSFFHPPILAAEKAPHDAQELREPVVMEPVAGPVDADHLCLTEVADPPVLGGVTGAAFPAVEQEGRARDPRPEQLDVATLHVVGRPRAHVVVELPAVRPVLVLVRAVLGEVPRLLDGEARVLLLHPAEGVLDRAVAARQAAGEVTLLADPLVHALDDRPLLELVELSRRGAETFDGHEPGNGLGIETGVTQGDLAAERVGDDRHRRQALLMDELRQIVDVAGEGVAAVGGPRAVAVPAQVGRQDVPVVPECRGRPVPGAAVITAAVQHDERRLRGIAPVDVVQAQALREERVGRGSRHGAGHGSSSMLASRPITAVAGRATVSLSRRMQWGRFGCTRERISRRTSSRS